MWQCCTLFHIMTAYNSKVESPRFEMEIVLFLMMMIVTVMAVMFNQTGSLFFGFSAASFHWNLNTAHIHLCNDTPIFVHICYHYVRFLYFFTSDNLPTNHHGSSLSSQRSRCISDLLLDRVLMKWYGFGLRQLRPRVECHLQCLPCLSRFNCSNGTSYALIWFDSSGGRL